MEDELTRRRWAGAADRRRRARRDVRVPSNRRSAKNPATAQRGCPDGCRGRPVSHSGSADHEPTRRCSGAGDGKPVAANLPCRTSENPYGSACPGSEHRTSKRERTHAGARRSSLLRCRAHTATRPYAHARRTVGPTYGSGATSATRPGRRTRLDGPNGGGGFRRGAARGGPTGTFTVTGTTVFNLDGVVPTEKGFSL